MENLEVKILDSVKTIEKSQWDSIFGDIPEGYGFFRATEESKLEGFSFFYVIIYEQGTPVLIAPLFSVDFNLDIAVDGPIQKIISLIRKPLKRFLVVKTLFCGSPFSENSILGIKNAVRNRQALINELSDVMDSICRKKRIPFIMFKDLLEENVPDLKCLEDHSFFLVESFPSVATELNFKSWDDYLKTLSKNTRKDLKRKIKKSQSANNIDVKIRDNVVDVIDDIYKLYLNTYYAGKVKFEKLTKEFFLNVSREMPSQVKYFLYYFDGKLAAFNLCFIHKNKLIDKFIGFDYDLAFKYNLYFFSWCYNVKWCLENSLSVYEVGQTDYHPKLKLGGKLTRLHAYVKHNNPLLNIIFRFLAKLLIPSNFDTQIKQNGQG